MNLENFRESISHQNDGSVCTIGDAVFTVRRANTSAYTKAFVEIKKALFKPWYQEHELSDDQLLEATGCLLAEYLVTGWEGVENEDGTELKYSPENSFRLFTNKEYWQSLNLIIIGHASNYSNYLYKNLQEAKEIIKKP